MAIFYNYYHLYAQCRNHISWTTWQKMLCFFCTVLRAQDMEGTTGLILGSFSMVLPTCLLLLHNPIWRAGKCHKPQLIYFSLDEHSQMTLWHTLSSFPLLFLGPRKSPLPDWHTLVVKLFWIYAISHLLSPVSYNFFKQAVWDIAMLRLEGCCGNCKRLAVGGEGEGVECPQPGAPPTPTQQYGQP